MRERMAVNDLSQPVELLQQPRVVWTNTDQPDGKTGPFAIVGAFAAGWSIGSAIDCLYLMYRLPATTLVAVGYHYRQPAIEVRVFQLTARRRTAA